MLIPRKTRKGNMWGVLDIFKQLQINISFSEALEKMSTYARFMKQILTKKRNYTYDDIIHLNARYGVIIQRNLPQKEKDPGRVALSITIGNINITKKLINLCSNINHILLSVVRQICDLDIKNMKMTL